MGERPCCCCCCCCNPPPSRPTLRRDVEPNFRRFAITYVVESPPPAPRRVPIRTQGPPALGDAHDQASRPGFQGKQGRLGVKGSCRALLRGVRAVGIGNSVFVQTLVRLLLGAPRHRPPPRPSPAAPMGPKKNRAVRVWTPFQHRPMHRPGNRPKITGSARKKA